MKTTAHRHGRRYTTEEIRKLMQDWEADVPLEEVAVNLETTTRAILHMVQRLRADGIPMKRRTRGHKRDGRAYKLWTQQEIEYLFRRRLTGASAEEIGVDLGRTASAIQQMIDVLRKGGVPIAMRGQGVRRLWSLEDLKAAAAGRFDPAEIELAADIPN
jgi:biotin operon repressor